MKKNYILDSNVLLEDENCIENLRNGIENNIFIPYTVLEEIDSLKKNSNVSHLARSAISKIYENSEFIEILNSYNPLENISNDDKILSEISDNIEILNLQDSIFVTNDKMLRFKANKKGIKTQEYKRSNPFLSESQKYTGFIEENQEYIPNCFYWNEGKLYFNNEGKSKLIDYENEVWDIKPRHYTQNCMLELILNDKIDVISVCSEAGYGKSFLSLASALYLTLQKKKYKKIFIFKKSIDVGNIELGFLPGDYNEKTAPYFRPLVDLVKKLHEIRPANKLFINPKVYPLIFDEKIIEFLPSNFIRGMNIDDSIVIISEAQNFTRLEMRTILSRMGQNVKVIIEGDIKQIDEIHNNEYNNAINWVVKCFKGLENYGHIILSGKNSRGPICDMTLKRGL